ncbi:MAG TPA: response regulator [Gammaproteobacteria bacterium]|nr:response regulator [Gammaproteobacteria bacterium]
MSNPPPKTILNKNKLSAKKTDREQMILAERIHIIFHQPLLKILLLGQGITVGITVIFLWGTVAPELLLVWLAWMVVMTIFWGGITLYYRHTLPPPQKAKRWAYIYLCSGLLLGATWGVTAFWPRVLADPSATVFLAIVVFGITTAGLAVFAPLLPAFYAFTMLSLVPYAIHFFIEGGKLYVTLGVMFLLYLLIILIIGDNMRRTLLESVLLRFENMELVNDLIKKNTLAEKAREQAVQAGMEKSKFIAAASHDLRQPLHALGLFVDALESRIRFPEVRKIVDNVRLATATLSDLMNGMLDISKLDAGVLQPVVSEFSIQPLLDRIAIEAEQNASEKGLRFRLRHCRAVVRSDSNMLDRILRNLVANAIHYTEQGSILVACRYRKKNLCIEVRDSGIGIDKNKLEKIFKDFYQVDNPERDRAKGHGLGLAIVERLAKLLGHTLTVNSKPGQGSTFCLCLPRVTNLSPTLEMPPSPPVYLDDVAGATVLVIDDEIMVCEGMADILTRWGCKALLADSAETAWEQLKANGLQVDVIISDYRLRENKTGVEAIECLQKKTRQVFPVIIVTGDTAADRLREANASGYHLLHKPVSPGKLRSLLSYLLNDSRTEFSDKKSNRPLA